MFAASKTAAAPLTNYIEDLFNVYLYTGNSTTGGSQTITTGVNLSARGGLVWIKRYGSTTDFVLTDTARGAGTSSTANKIISSNSTSGENLGGVAYDFLSAFNYNGFSVTQGGASTLTRGTNYNATDYVAWSFAKQTKFFDVVTYPGNGANRSISHNLGAVPGCIFIKRTDTTGDWQVYHRSLANTEYLVLNTTAAKATSATLWNSTTPTATDFTVGTDATVNANGGTYVAYLFAHDAGGFGATGTENGITCGSFTTDSSGNATISLGYEPQFVIIKSTSATSNWITVDSMRGMSNGYNDYCLNLNLNTSQASASTISPTATGFLATAITASVRTYAFIAIRRGPMRFPESGTSVLGLNARTGTGASAIIQGGVLTDVLLTKDRSAVNDSIIGARLTGGAFTRTPSTAAELVSSTVIGISSWSQMNGVEIGTNSYVNASGDTYINYFFKRAPGFFDVVCYTGTNVNNQSFNHNLNAIPQLIIIKRRDATENWGVYTSVVNNANYYLTLNTTDEKITDTNSLPTSSLFYVPSGNTAVNASGGTYTSYLFGSLNGISKVSSFYGNGTSQTINCGFTTGARFVMIKRIDSPGDWYVWDSARGIVSGNDPYFLLNSSAAEVTTNDSVDADNSGFIVNQLSATNVNLKILDSWITSSIGSNIIYVTAYVGNLYFRAGTNGTSSWLSTSSDAITWTPRTSAMSTSDIYAAAYGNNLYLVAGQSGRLSTSPDAITWTARTTGVAGIIRGLAYGNGVYVLVGDSNVLRSSTNGTTWTSRTSGFTGTNDILDVIYDNGIFVAVGQSGQMSTSTDGITWTARTSGFGTTTINSVVYGNGIFLAVGASGKVSTSTDGITWTAQTAITGAPTLNSVSYGSGYFVTVGQNSAMFSSTNNGSSWTTITSPFAAGDDINGVSYGDQGFITGGVNAAATGGIFATSLIPQYLYLAIA